MYTVSSPPHLHCIYMGVIFFADDNVDQPLFVVDHFMIVSMYRQIRFNSQLDRVTHRCCSSPGSF